MLWILVPLFLLWLLVLAWSYWDTRSELEEIFDRNLEQSARALLSQGSSGSLALFEGTGEESEERHPIIFRRWSPAGKVLLQSPDAAMLPPPGPAGFSDFQRAGQLWRLFSVKNAQGVQVQMAETYAVRDELAREFALSSLLPIGIAFPLLALLIGFGVERGLRPLQRLVATLEQRSSHALEPVDIGEPPRELRPLLDAVNSLLGRLREAFERERRFTADAAHELRTPIAAIRMQAQVASRSRDGDERRHALSQLLRASDRAGHLLAQLLSLARLEPGREMRLHAVDVNTVLAEVAGELMPEAHRRDVQLLVERTESAVVIGDPVALAILLRNLVDNALRYTPAGGRVLAAVRREGERVILRVQDSGMGIPAAERARVFERFYRILGSGVEGSGLGLSIVARIAEIHQAEIHLNDAPDGPGLLVEVGFRAGDVHLS